MGITMFIIIPDIRAIIIIAIVFIILYILYIASIELANKRLSRVLPWWRWYHGYTVLALSLPITILRLKLASPELHYIANTPAVAMSLLLRDHIPVRRIGLSEPQFMALSSLAVWLLIGGAVQGLKMLRKWRRRGSMPQR